MKNQEHINNSQEGKKKSTETNSKITYVWKLVDKDVMPAVTTLLSDVKENMLVMSKELNF